MGAWSKGDDWQLAKELFPGAVMLLGFMCQSTGSKVPSGQAGRAHTLRDKPYLPTTSYYQWYQY